MHLHLDDVAFRYRRRDRPILDGLSVTFSAGRTILLGPNGAGKSTLLAIAASVLTPDRGRVHLDGNTAVGPRTRSEHRRLVAWTPQTVRAASGLSAREQVALHGWLAGLSRSAAWDRAGAALTQVDLAPRADHRATRLSGGQKARLGIAQALVHDAQVLLLDEPTAALDPDQRDVFAGLIAELAESRTVVVSTHDVADLEQSYDHVVVLDRGEVRFDGAITAFLAPSGERRSVVEAYRASVGGR